MVGPYARRLMRRRAPTNASAVLHRSNVAGSGIGSISMFRTMLSIPTGFGQQGVAGFDSVMRSVSISCSDATFTVSKLPNVFGTVPVIVNIGFWSKNPLNTNGIVVMLE